MRCITKTGQFPYWNEPEYQSALDAKADIVIIMFGTNDSLPAVWNDE